MKFKQMMQMQKKYNKKVLKNISSNVEKEQVTQNLVLCAHSELSDLISKTNYKKHHLVNCDIPQSFDESLKEKILYESVDVVRYMMAIMNVWDIQPDEFTSAFHKKDIYLNSLERIKNNPWDGKKPVVIVDIDDVLAEFRLGFATWIERKFNVSPNVESEEYYFIDALKETDTNPEAIFMQFVSENGFLKFLKPTRGALNFLNTLRKEGYWIHLLTARPDDNVHCFYDTYHWLFTHAFPYDDLSFSSEKFRWCAQSKYYDSGSIKFAIDDSPKHATEYAKHGICVKVPRKSYNKHINIKENVEYYDNFEDLISKIKEK